MSRLQIVRATALLFALASPVAAQSATTLPFKLAPKPTAAAISEADLMTRLYIFADDSMQGRQFGREGNMKGTDYIARELKRLGLEPMGDNGTYFQSLPVVVRKYTEQSMLAVDGKALKWNTDFVARPTPMPRLFTSAQVIFGGVAFDTVNSITREQAAGKIVILLPAPPAQPGAGFGGGGGGGFAARNPMTRYADAAAIATVDLAALSMGQRAFINNPAGTWRRTAPNAPPIVPGTVPLSITPEAAAMLMGKAIDGLAPGTPGGNVTAKLDWQETPRPEWGRNVIAVVRGSDPKLRGQYVAVGAHNDHVGFTATPVDHDSLRAVTTTALKATIVGKDSIKALPPDVRRAMTANVDSLRKIRPARLDSIRNGADDDGSGSMALLEIAEQIAKMPVKPKRSVIFVWHTGEEAGLLGATFFTQNPTVPKDSIVAQINVDMIGRGRADDIPGGSDDFLGVVGSGFISNDLGEAVRTVNSKQAKPLALDYRFDADVSGTLGSAYNSIYTRSDHYRYAQIGIPIAFFFTGLHADYHQVTDEPQYIDYKHYTRITKYLNDLALEIANREKRPAITKPTP
jgi:hypothetical protein